MKKTPNFRAIVPHRIYRCETQNGFKQALLNAFCGDEPSMQDRAWTWNRMKDDAARNYPKKYPCLIVVQIAYPGYEWDILYTDVFM